MAYSSLRLPFNYSFSSVCMHSINFFLFLFLSSPASLMFKHGVISNWDRCMNVFYIRDGSIRAPPGFALNRFCVELSFQFSKLSLWVQKDKSWIMYMLYYLQCIHIYIVILQVSLSLAFCMCVSINSKHIIGSGYFQAKLMMLSIEAGSFIYYHSLHVSSQWLLLLIDAAQLLEQVMESHWAAKIRQAG